MVKVAMEHRLMRTKSSWAPWRKAIPKKLLQRSSSRLESAQIKATLRPLCDVRS